MVANGEVAAQNNLLLKMNLREVSSLAEQFVLQYYTVMNQYPEFLYRFYSDESVLIYESQPVSGQADINNLLTKLNLKDTRVTILKVDALKGHGNSVMVQVCGEQSIAGGLYRRFMRSFTLVERGPNSFAVIGDIFQYQDRVYIPEKKQLVNTNVSDETEAKQTESKQSAKAPANVGSVDNKNANRHKHAVPKAEKQLAKKTETDSQPRPASPKAQAEPAPRNPSESNVHSQQSAPHKPEQTGLANSTKSKAHILQNTDAQQQQVTDQQQKSASNVQMSWAQRASNNPASTPPTRILQSSKASASEKPAQPSTAKAGGNTQQRPVRVTGVYNNSASISSGLPNNQSQPQQARLSGNREQNSEWIDVRCRGNENCKRVTGIKKNTQVQGQQSQHGGRSGFGGPKGNMRTGGGNRGGNRGSIRGGNRGPANPSAAPPRQ